MVGGNPNGAMNVRIPEGTIGYGIYARQRIFCVHGKGNHVARDRDRSENNKEQKQLLEQLKQQGL